MISFGSLDVGTLFPLNLFFIRLFPKAFSFLPLEEKGMMILRVVLFVYSKQIKAFLNKTISMI